MLTMTQEGWPPTVVRNEQSASSVGVFIRVPRVLMKLVGERLAVAGFGSRFSSLRFRRIRGLGDLQNGRSELLGVGEASRSSSRLF